MLFEFNPILRDIILIGIGSTTTMFAFHYLIEPISRRETNFAFIAFIVAFVSALIVIEIGFFIFLHLLHERSKQKKLPLDPLDERYQSGLFESLGRAGLPMFLTANILTGVVNFSIDTISMTSNALTLIVLLVYCVLLVTICRLLCSTPFYATRSSIVKST